MRTITVFIATPEQAKRYPTSMGADYSARAALEHAEIEGLDSRLLGLLRADLVDVAWDAKTHDLRTVAQPGRDDGFLWLLDEFPEDYVALIASVPSGRLDVALTRWLSREELKGWRLADGHEVFGQLQALARSARQQGKGLYLFNAL